MPRRKTKFVLKTCPEGTPANKHKRIEELEYLKEILPLSTRGIVCCSDQTDNGNFKAVLRLSLRSKSEALQWLSEFSEKSLTTWRCAKTYPSLKTSLVKYKADFICHHGNVRKMQVAKCKTKKTGCLARLSIIVKESINIERRQDIHQGKLPTKIILHWSHNHPLCSPSTLCYRDVGPAARQRLLELFLRGFGVSSALDVYKAEIELCCDENLIDILADRRVMPEEGFARRLRSFLSEHRSTRRTFSHPPITFTQLKSDLQKLQHQESSDFKMAMDDDEENVIVAFLTPLMERVHKLMPQAAEVAFVDQSGGMDRYQLRVFLLLTHSPVGGLPLGVFLSTSESSEAIETGLRLLKGLLGPSAFYGRGDAGPHMFITDESDAEKTAFSTVYPNSMILLSIFHIIQTVWRNLWSQSYGIERDHRPHLLNIIKGVMYATTEDQVEHLWKEVTEDALVLRYPKVFTHFSSLWEKRKEWAYALTGDLYTKDLYTKDHTTDSLADATMRTFRDRLLCQHKIIHPVQLAHCMTMFLSKYYERKILDDVEGITNTKAQKASKNVEKNALLLDNVMQLDDTNFEVAGPDEKQVCFINTDLGTCSCPLGAKGCMCRHQLLVFQKFRAGNLFNTLLNSSTSMEMHHILSEVATGNKPATQEGFCDDSLDDNDDYLSQNEPSAADKTTERLQTAFAKFDQWAADMKMKVQEDPDTLLGPLEKFLAKIEPTAGARPGCKSASPGSSTEMILDKSAGQGSLIRMILDRPSYPVSSTTSPVTKMILASYLKRKQSLEVEPSLLPHEKIAKSDHSYSSMQCG